MPASLRAHLARSTTRPYDRRSPVPSSPALSDNQFQPQLSPRPNADLPSSPIAPPPPPGPPIADHPGMPTYAQYKRIEGNYKSGLSPRKRDKALITQAMFDKIWDVLHQPEACSIETPQFRFWVRKMFMLGRPAPDWDGRRGRDGDGGKLEEEEEDDYDEVGDETKMEMKMKMKMEEMEEMEEMEMPTAVVLHENRPVAVMEQLYELFCYCHELSGHGGRDKTCAVIRQHYSWVPKELTAQFVKACPTCTIKRSGNPDMIALVQEKTMTPKRPCVSGRVRKGAINVVEDDGAGAEPSSPGWPTTGGPLDPANPEPCGAQERARERDARGENVIGSSDLSDSVILPILRESPLANLAQEGWTLRGASSPLAHVPGSLKLHDTGGRSEFKVADAAPPQGHSGENSKAVDRQIRRPVDTRMRLPSLTSVLSNGSLDDTLNLTGLGTENQDDTEALPPVLRQLQISEPINHQLPSYLFQIDPVLLAFNYPGSGTAAVPASGIEPPLAAFGINDNNLNGLDLGIGTPSGIVRNATYSDTLRHLEETSDQRILPFWTDPLPSTLSMNGPFSLDGLSGSPLRNAPDRGTSMDFEMHGLPEMDSPDRSTSSASSSDSPDSSFEYSGPPWSGTTIGASGASVLPFSFSSPVAGCGSRYEYGAPPFLLAATSPTDDVGRQLSGTLSLTLITDA